MIAMRKVIEMRVCFQNRLKNSIILINTTHVEEARRIARIWGERAEGEKVTRTICCGQVAPYDAETISADRGGRGGSDRGSRRAARAAGRAAGRTKACGAARGGSDQGIFLKS